MKLIAIIAISFSILSCNEHQRQKDVEVKEYTKPSITEIDNDIISNGTVVIFNEYINDMHYLIFKSATSENSGTTTIINLTKDSLEVEYYKKIIGKKL